MSEEILLAGSCKCPIKPNMDYETLLKKVLPHNCCAPYYLCSKLDKELRRADQDRTRKAYFEKKKAEREAEQSVA